jgi:hypothetical protein
LATIDFKDGRGFTPAYLSEAASEEFRNHISAYLTHYMFLNSLAKAATQPIFHATSKFHSLHHVGFESQFQAPGMARTYANEGHMGTVARVGFSTRHAVPPHARARSLTEKIALGKAIHFTSKARKRNT